MKKTFLLLLALLLACQFAGCEATDETSSMASREELASSETVSTAEENLFALIGWGDYTEGRANLIKQRDVTGNHKTWMDSELEGTQQIFSLSDGIELPMLYTGSAQDKRSFFSLDQYSSKDGEQILSLNHETGNLTTLTIVKFPENYPLLTTEISREEAFPFVQAFLSKHRPDISLEEWTAVSSTVDYEHQFDYLLYRDEIVVGQMSITTDLCGNVYLFAIEETGENTPPVYSDEECLEAAQERLAECFTGEEGSINNMQITEKRAVYLVDYGTRAIGFKVEFSAKYKNGNDARCANWFYLPYDENGKHISFADEELPSRQPEESEVCSG